MERTAVFVKSCLIVVGLVTPVFAGNPSGSPTLSFIHAGSYSHGSISQISLGDLDGDGDLDAVFGVMHDRCELWMNDGTGRFTKTHQSLGVDGHGVAIEDLDGDGDLDVLIARLGDSITSSVYLNDGTGRFALVDSLDDRGLAAESVSMFDLEGDGDLDACIHYTSHRSIVYVNDSTGRFARRAETISGATVWGDLDGDGDVDAISWQEGTGYRILSNSGHGDLDETEQVSAPSQLMAGNTVLLDADGDGDLDLVGAHGQRLTPKPLVILRNDGCGIFEHVPEGRILIRSAKLSVGDFDGDGLPDVFLRDLEREDMFGLNDGTGGFTDSGLRLGPDGTVVQGHSAVGDLDGDGDVDLFLAPYVPEGPAEVWMNTTDRRAG
jgi:hypothetical protein